MYAPQIVKYINAVLQSQLSGKQFQRGIYFDIAKQVIRKGDGEDQTPFVVIFDNEGNDLSDIINDKYSLVVYHRMTGYGFTAIEQNQRDSFGDGARVKGLTMNMVMVVYGNRNVLKMTNEELSALMYCYFPSELPPSLKEQLVGLQQVSFSPVATNNVSAQIEQTEGIKVHPENILFALNYVVKEEVNTICFGGCDFSFNTDSLCFELCAPQAGATFTLPPFETDANVNSYQKDILKGKTLAFVLFDNMPLRIIATSSGAAQCSLNNGLFTLTDTAFPVTAGQLVTIGYK